MFECLPKSRGELCVDQVGLLLNVAVPVRPIPKKPWMFLFDENGFLGNDAFAQKLRPERYGNVVFAGHGGPQGREQKNSQIPEARVAFLHVSVESDFQAATIRNRFFERVDVKIFQRFGHFGGMTVFARGK